MSPQKILVVGRAADLLKTHEVLIDNDSLRCGQGDAPIAFIPLIPSAPEIVRHQPFKIRGTGRPRERHAVRRKQNRPDGADAPADVLERSRPRGRIERRVLQLIGDKIEVPVAHAGEPENTKRVC